MVTSPDKQLRHSPRSRRRRSLSARILSLLLSCASATVTSSCARTVGIGRADSVNLDEAVAATPGGAGDAVDMAVDSAVEIAADSADDTAADSAVDSADTEGQLDSGLGGIASIDMAGDTACAIDSSARVFCWGRELGGTRTLVRPTLVELPGRASQVSVGPLDACALLNDGSVMCWGANDADQLAAPGADRTSPVRVALPAPGIDLSVGRAIGCAVLAHSGEVWCWGQQLALVSPTLLGAVQLPESVSGKWGHVCLRSGMPVSCRGDLTGQDLGPGLGGMVALPTVTNLAHTSSLTTSPFGTCATDDSGHVACWGSAVPTPAPIPSFARSVTLGQSHACILDSTATSWCWGEDRDGQLGRDPSSNIPGQADRVQGINGVVQIAASWRSTCAIVGVQRRVFCWGYNAMGTLGDGSLVSRHTPAPVLPPS